MVIKIVAANVTNIKKMIIHIPCEKECVIDINTVDHSWNCTTMYGVYNRNKNEVDCKSIFAIFIILYFACYTCSHDESFFRNAYKTIMEEYAYNHYHPSNIAGTIYRTIICIYEQNSRSDEFSIIAGIFSFSALHSVIALKIIHIYHYFIE